MDFKNMGVEHIPQENFLKHIERCARVTYKSESKFKNTVEDSQKFVDMLVANGHTSPLAHATIYLIVENDRIMYEKYVSNPWSRVVVDDVSDSRQVLYITTNYRVVVENGWLEDLKYMTDAADKHIRRETFKFVHDIGLSRESNRHTSFAITEESTRFVNYKTKNDGLCFCGNSDLPVEDAYTYPLDHLSLCKKIIFNQGELTDIDIWMYSMMTQEFCYNELIRRGFKPQQARRVLGLMVKTETYYTAFVNDYIYNRDWNHYLSLRIAQSAHPDIRKLAYKVNEKLKKLGYFV